MRWHVAVRLLVFFVVPATFCAASAAMEPSALNGHWKKAVSPPQDARRTESIDGATADLNFIIRGIARSRLEKRSTAPDDLDIRIDKDKLTIRETDKHWELRLNGKPQRFSDADSEGTVVATVDRGKAVITANGENGRRTTTFTPSDDGKTLLWTVTIVSERLSKPVEASVTYRRVRTTDDAAPSPSTSGPPK